MSWLVFAASCLAILVGMEIAEMALIIGGLGGMFIALALRKPGNRDL
jgi:hypothetical protein